MTVPLVQRSLSVLVLPVMLIVAVVDPEPAATVLFAHRRTGAVTLGKAFARGGLETGRERRAIERPNRGLSDRLVHRWVSGKLLVSRIVRSSATH
jgi:hypothetical protein